MSEISIVIGGSAGQGIKTIKYILTRVFKFSGINVFSTKEYESRVRGGINSTEILVSSNTVNTHVDKIDLLLVLKEGVIDHLKNRIGDNTLVLGEKENISDSEKSQLNNFYNIPIKKLAQDVGKKIYSNSIVVGVICGLFNLDDEIVKNIIQKKFSSKGEQVINKNIEATQAGQEEGLKLKKKNKIEYEIPPDESVTNDILLNGTEAVALGAMNGGCNFVSFYPMSPATGVATFFSKNSDELEIVVEQMEDEIGAVNMAIGGWYAGARAMVTTSGGGLALMNEGLSLAGVTESPMVFHIGQRPGPGTGLPTRMGQEDLLFSLFGGHGEFPRIILAPGDLKEGYELGRKAFELADKYQVPVFILTDQYYLDSDYNISELPFSDKQPNDHIVKSEKGYQRYKLTEDGISPRAIPGNGEGTVEVDSDEHGQNGHVTENFDTRTKMVDKRLKKAEKIKEEYIQPEIYGDDNYKTLLIGWGSTKNAILAALSELDTNKLGYLHLKQLAPLDEYITDRITEAQRTITIENNATAQLAKILAMETEKNIDDNILKYNGLPFSKEELIEEITKIKEV